MNKNRTKAGPNVVGMDFRERLSGFYRAALKDDRAAAKLLLGTAHYATFLVEHLFKEKPELVREWARREDEFPVLMSWNKRYNTRHHEVITQLDLGGMLPLKTDVARDEFYTRLRGDHIPLLGLETLVGDIVLPPLTNATKACRQWARAVADSSYPKNRPLALPVEVNSVDWQFSKGFAEHYRRLRLKRHKLRSNYPGSEIGEMRQRTKAEASQKLTWGDFRSGFIDLVASRLKHGVRESPWHFYGGIKTRQLTTKRRGAKTLKSS